MKPAGELFALIQRMTNGRLTPWVKQIPTVVSFCVALLVMVFCRMPVSSWPEVAASAVIVAAGTAASLLLPWRRLDPRWSVLIPSASFIAIALLRDATGGSQSAFSSLLVIPIIWVAAEPERWNVLIAFLGTAVALLLPVYLDPAPVSVRDIVRAFFAPFVFLLAAVIINEVARRLRRAGEEAARLKDEFLGLVSHELRNPLTSVLGYLELLRIDPSPLTAAQEGYISVAERNAHRLQHLVGDLLLTAQVNAGAFLVEKAPVDLDTVVSQSAESAGPAADEAQVRLQTRLEPGIEIEADAERLAQAIDNLVSNALKFTPAGGTVTVSTRREGGTAVVEVSDTGIGIPADELQHLTERFFRTSNATQAAIPGVGLGLAITQAIAIAHGGALEVTSTQGEGTAFMLRLPA